MFFQDKKAVELYMGKAYQTLQGYCTEQSLWTLNIQAADECAVPINNNGAWTEPRYRELQQHTFTASNTLIERGWDFCFDGIAACNDVIKKMSDTSIQFAEKGKIISEIRVLRAFYYFCAMDAWGNIPFSTDPDDKSYPPQKDRAFIFDFIISEIEDSKDDLDDIPSSANYGRTTQGAAYTLLAKIYLNAEEWVGTPMYDKAEEACLRVIESGKYHIENDYKKNFEVVNETSRENIFVIPYDNVYTQTDHSSFVIFMMALDAVNAEKFNIPATVWNGFVCQPDFFELYDTADVRLAATWLYGQQYNSSGQPVSGYIINGVFDEAKYLSGRAQTDGAKLWKWTYQPDVLTSDQQGMSNDYAVFRYADVLYMYAEALIRQGKGVSAAINLADFALIRTRAGLQPFSTLDEETLLKERGIELAWEGWRRQDLIRFGRWGDKWWAKPSSSPAKKLYPLPTRRIRVNPNLVQNPGY
jgi:hypothetical protein